MTKMKTQGDKHTGMFFFSMEEYILGHMMVTKVTRVSVMLLGVLRSV